MAAKAATDIPIKPPLFVRLLIGIHAAFAALKEPEEGSKRIETGALIEFLCADKEAGWDEANKGRPINPHWLSERLRGRIENPPHSKDWWEGTANAREHKSGYLETQLTALFDTYLSEDILKYYRGSPDPLQVDATGAGGAGVEPAAPVAPLKHSSGVPSTKSETDGQEDAPPPPDHSNDASRPPSASDAPVDETIFLARCAENGLDPTAVRVIQAYRHDHPDWSASQLRRRVHIPLDVVELVFNVFPVPGDRAWSGNDSGPSSSDDDLSGEAGFGAVVGEEDCSGPLVFDEPRGRQTEFSAPEDGDAIRARGRQRSLARHFPK